MKAAPCRAWPSGLVLQQFSLKQTPTSGATPLDSVSISLNAELPLHIAIATASFFRDNPSGTSIS